MCVFFLSYWSLLKSHKATFVSSLLTSCMHTNCTSITWYCDVGRYMITDRALVYSVFHAYYISISSYMWHKYKPCEEHKRVKDILIELPPFLSSNGRNNAWWSPSMWASMWFSDAVILKPCKGYTWTPARSQTFRSSPLFATLCTRWPVQDEAGKASHWCLSSRTYYTKDW